MRRGGGIFRNDPRTADGLQRFAAEKSDTSSVTLYSHDWSDPTTWLEDATRVVDEVATDSGDQLAYNLVNTAVIDTYHGKITQEDFKVDADGYSYRVIVKVNDVVKTEQDPHVGSGGDYTINYAAGTVAFESSLDPADVVKVTYHYAGSGVFTIKPEAGKLLKVEVVEVQFSDNVVVNDTVRFQPYGYVDVFAPHLTPVPFPSGTLIPLGDPLVYKGMRDYMNDAFRAYPAYPSNMGGTGWRGLANSAYVLDWDYTRAKPLYASMGMEIRLTMDNDAQFGGDYATATFYCSTVDES